MDGYELLDAGGGGRLERFGAFVADRPQPAALDERLAPDRWFDADLIFDRTEGWTGPATEAAAASWTADLAGLSLELRPTDSGQVGVFPEHAAMIPWLRERVTRRVTANAGGTNVLHLFAYTGLVTLALAGA
ncbi:MAG TPA: hypothetical protein VD763_01405, partial [Candidatus Saccharimonadales bacterium]|nr:hypothetical protein [Candidatus Saccharimonadales bacterium]